MLHTVTAPRGMIAAPHHLAAQSGLDVLRDGGNAIEAMVAAAATIAVVYPHMNALGGDAFWIIHEPGRPPMSIDGSGAAGKAVDIDLFKSQGFSSIPATGPMAAITVAGAVSSWQSALEVSQSRWGGSLSLERLLGDAITYARSGYAVSAAQRRTTVRLKTALAALPGFADHFLAAGEIPDEGSVQKNPALAETLGYLARHGLDDFYRGEVARRIAADLARIGSPLKGEDMARHRSVRRRPLSLPLPGVTLFNAPPPTQGLASLMILGLFERHASAAPDADSFEHLHGLVEATKVAFKVRNAHITDPLYMSVHPTTYLNDHVLDKLSEEISRRTAAPWPAALRDGDTVYLTAADSQGRVVSFIQSIYHGYGSGMVLPDSGILWHNRGHAFSLDPRNVQALAPGRKPFHTLSPALAKFQDGRVMAYGTMGGDGQPQTQAALFTRYARYGQSLQQAVTAPRWVLGKTLDGGKQHDLKVESRFDPAVIQALGRAGHDVSVLGPFEDIMGHAAALVLRPDGWLEGAVDPRGDGVVAGF
ncbi:gamma-glutamyltransferase family protein [Insolitispirillum peregrinum]|uniref:Gamma-glutamyltransferase 2. Threonine peptidase. MEROPS family T03 n=1 Tax=Insolitispirillum peregrinum TaxID=80876 RepID=A0A1N7MNN0_9PROT|nr:gamma-glutamyltransferase family protein [Insolitispirillum peregrinum]SIS87707.1 gamma-glutamyltransferase 2. Threonine peptidase. MEROPS family T03 [Insolitispirillum peregrinum]